MLSTPAQFGSLSADTEDTFEEEMNELCPAEPSFLHQSTLGLRDLFEGNCPKYQSTPSPSAFVYSPPIALNDTSKHCSNCNGTGSIQLGLNGAFEPCPERCSWPLRLFGGRFELVQRVGVGTFASTWSAHDRFHSGLPVALKIMHSDAWQIAADEIRILNWLRTGRVIGKRAEARKPSTKPFIDPELQDAFEHVLLRTFGCFRVGRHVVMVSELLRPVLTESFATFKDFRKKETLGFLRRVAHGVSMSLHFLHTQHHCMHADLKWANVMFSSPDGIFKLIDYGNVISLCETRQYHDAFEVASPAYRAPELLLGSASGFDEAVDWWSLGCVLAEAVLGEPLFSSDALIGDASASTGTKDHCHRLLHGIQVLFGNLESLFPKCMFSCRMATLDEPYAALASRSERATLLAQLLKLGCGDFADFLARLLEPDPKLRMRGSEALRHCFLLPLQPGLLLLK